VSWRINMEITEQVELEERVRLDGSEYTRLLVELSREELLQYFAV
jgi:hypothetical protein